MDFVLPSKFLSFPPKNMSDRECRPNIAPLGAALFSLPGAGAQVSREGQTRCGGQQCLGPSRFRLKDSFFSIA